MPPKLHDNILMYRTWEDDTLPNNAANDDAYFPTLSKQTTNLLLMNYPPESHRLSVRQQFNLYLHLSFCPSTLTLITMIRFHLCHQMTT